ncbi:hypothetical protein M1O56_05760 [Dehalococcoidia bacterium]|nr:hypothetical protein [Dehalococcoidia bacterium]
MENWIAARNKCQMILGLLWIDSPTIDVEIDDDIYLTIPVPKWARGLPNTETNIQSIAGSRYALTWSREMLHTYGGIEYAASLEKDEMVESLAYRFAKAILAA